MTEPETCALRRDYIKAELQLRRVKFMATELWFPAQSLIQLFPGSYLGNLQTVSAGKRHSASRRVPIERNCAGSKTKTRRAPTEHLAFVCPIVFDELRRGRIAFFADFTHRLQPFFLALGPIRRAFHQRAGNPTGGRYIAAVTREHHVNKCASLWEKTRDGVRCNQLKYFVLGLCRKAGR